MTVKDLIKALQTVEDKTKQVKVWIDDFDRYPVSSIDELDDTVDINIY